VRPISAGTAVVVKMSTRLLEGYWTNLTTFVSFVKKEVNFKETITHHSFVHSHFPTLSHIKHTLVYVCHTILMDKRTLQELRNNQLQFLDLSCIETVWLVHSHSIQGNILAKKEPPNYLKLSSQTHLSLRSILNVTDFPPVHSNSIQIITLALRELSNYLKHSR
jgi:hypothetical protein